MTEHRVTYEEHTSRTAARSVYVYTSEATRIRSPLEVPCANYVLLYIPITYYVLHRVKKNVRPNLKGASLQHSSRKNYFMNIALWKVFFRVNIYLKLEKMLELSTLSVNAGRWAWER